MRIVPAIFEKDFKEVVDKLEYLRGKYITVQIDVADEKFSGQNSFVLKALKGYEFEKEFVWEVHLMVDRPELSLGKCREVEALRVYGQVEKMEDREEFIGNCEEMGMEAGLAFDIDSEVEYIEKSVSAVLLMGRKAGWESRPIDEKVYKKIEKLMEYREKNNFNFEIAVDGGIDEEIIKKLEELGVDIAYCTSLIFGNKNK